MEHIETLIQEVADKIRRKALISALIHGAICIAGLLLSLPGLESMGHGGSYIIFWGAVVFGLIQCARAISRYVGATETATGAVAAYLRSEVR
ncbi:hypothetical protein LVY72_05720 [Arthrobacter sp. I2-34]|uniref:Uncharacterized protein n=1 Tax=Arthrobacter hankyongi TaxID=2904801 RepID=A0ABS9L419_9MICC|nr:hypothetical protein [Arthrobacter hankyongi]MCG2621413.1 hypothetical protein [Arthrobacter hankyongi]